MWVIRSALWWIDEHRVACAVTLVAVVAGLACLRLVVASDSSEPTAFERYAHLVEAPVDPSAATPPGRKPVPASELARPVGVQKRTCEAIEPRSPVVDVEPGTFGCREVSRLVAAYPAAPASHRTVEGFSCIADQTGFRVACAKSDTTAAVALILGPGGPGLTDCGDSGFSESGELVPIRASRVDCGEARIVVARFFQADEPAEIGGYSCSKRAQNRVATVSCERGRGEVAFALPGAGTAPQSPS